MYFCSYHGAKRFAVSQLDLKYCVRYHFTLLPVWRPQALPNWLLRKKKNNNLWFKNVPIFFFCGKHQTMCIGWIASQVCSVYGVFSCESPVNYYSVSVFRWEEFVGSESRLMRICLTCDYVSVPPPKHTTQCAIMLLALCGDLQYRCVTGPVWDCLFFFHI